MLGGKKPGGRSYALTCKTHDIIVDGDQWLAAHDSTITHDDARESIASRGSTRGTLSAHHKVDTGKDGFHLSLRDFSDTLRQLPLIDGHKLRHIRDGITI